MKREQPPRIEKVNWKSLGTGRPRVWDARVTAEGTWTMLRAEVAKAQWLLYVCVLEDGEFIPASTPAKEAIQRIEAVPAVGFVGCLRVNAGTLQFFTRVLKVRPEHQETLNRVVDLLRTQAEEAMSSALKGTLSKRVGPKDKPGKFAS